MERLSTLFRAAGGTCAAAELADLERRLDELWTRGRMAHPTLSVTAERFAEHLGRCGARVAGHDGIRAEDLFLACACLAGGGAAIAELHAIGAPAIKQSLMGMVGAASILEEVEQQIWEALLIGRGEAPKLATFAGRGPLGAWIGISAKRLAINILSREQLERRVRQEVAASHRLASADPEIEAVKDRYRVPFQEAIDAAIESLDDRGKMLYRLHLVDGATLERIAAIYGVTHPTIVRWLEKARQRILAEVRRRLRETVPLDSVDFDSLARLLASQLDLDISRVLSKAV